jgi:hypothetical protein
VREKYLPDIVSGRSGCAIAITEPNFGSDMSSLETSVKRDGDEFVISGVKKYITGAIEDDFYATFVRFVDILVRRVSARCWSRKAHRASRWTSVRRSSGRGVSRMATLCTTTSACRPTTCCSVRASSSV